MIVTGKHLSRRTLLRGLGTAIALPLFDAMTPAFAATTGAVKKMSPARMVFAYVPNGIDMPNWTPAADGAAFELPEILSPLKPVKDSVLVFTGLMDHNGMALGDGPGDHARASASFLTGVHPKKTAGSDILVGVSVDQLAAQQVGKATRLASLELGCEDGHLAGNCDSGYSCAYVNSISWRTPTVPNPPQVNPRSVFQMLFGNSEDAADPVMREHRLQFRRSILDFVADDTRKLASDLGPTDKRKLDEYLSAIREVERQIEVTEKQNAEKGVVMPSMAEPEGIPLEFSTHARLMFDLLTIALQTDTTRVATFMLAREGSNRSYREIGVPEGHHGLSHHRNDPALIAKIAKINRYHMEQFAYFIGKLKSTPDGDGTLLDHTMVAYGSGISDGNRHNHDDLPVLLAGGSAMYRTGKHVRFATDTPVTNLYLSMLDRMGVEVEKLGDSAGRLETLSELA
ncbi:MAG TPA: DUF1552 domain-containing protein [Bryobacteraceae bacterium]|jgi:hypothetical protein|nr:DUF1552 domain-containing protein [Bryobacteraceae bacterium]